jgi:hypothetical protein
MLESNLMLGRRRDYIAPMIHGDLSSHVTTPVDALLEAFVALCAKDDNHADPALLLNHCLKAVLPFCNPNAKTPGSMKLRDHLEE